MIEDDASIRRGLVDALTFAGYGAIECGRGDEGLELAISAEADLLLLDVVLPGIDGFTILKRLRQLRPQLPVILLTARGEEPDRVKGLAGGEQD
ncbi:MAG TPA: response regulator, partial [Planctomycetia bacterium]|nr:response regulator [Planctomycetia bacterium]